LQQIGASGEHVVLLYPPGLDFIEGFFGCLYAGAIAVPAYPPRLNRSQLRLNSIIQDVASKFLLGLSSLLSKIDVFSSDLPYLRSMVGVATDLIADGEACNWRRPVVAGSSVAFVQYTSGSTGAPKGVMLSHTNLLCNAALIHHAVEHSASDRYVSWLPMFHDMGFMAGVLQPLYAGIEAVLMSPAAFLQCPVRWLKAISRHKGTSSGGPNFAFDLCVRKIREEQKADLDLGRWTVAFNGSEPIRVATIDAFSKAFSRCGFKREAFFPCYGLAEATLMVAGGRKSALPVVKTLSAKGVGKGRVDGKPEEPSDEYTLVGCGQSLVNQEIAIVDPASLQPCSAGQIAEIWVSGPSVATGYWGRPKESKTIFGATLEGQPQRTYLRTGDLGFVLDGELFVAGRLKDLIIIRGVNYYPQDIESAVESVCPSLRPGCGAAFSVTVAGEERAVVVQETDRAILPEIDSVAAKVRDKVAEVHGVALHAIIFIKKGTIPKTSSGKIQRAACRDAFVEGKLVVLGGWQESKAAVVAPDNPQPIGSLPANAEYIETWLLARLEGKRGINRSNLTNNRPIVSFGLDSLQATELVHSIEEQFNISLSVADVLEGVTVEQLAAEILGEIKYPAARDIAAPSCKASAADEAIPLSYGQQALWFQHSLFPNSAVYNIFGSIRLLTRIEEPLLKKAFDVLTARHAALRTVFEDTSAGPVQIVRKQLPPDFRAIDVNGWPETEISALVQQEAHGPFDLQKGPLVRVRMLERGGSEQILLLVLHHIVADFWSLEILMRELFLAYQNELQLKTRELPTVRCQFPEAVRWQHDRLKSAKAESECTYWIEQLAGAPVLDLPVDHRWPAEPSYHAANVHCVIDRRVSERLLTVAQECTVTKFAVLLSAFQLLLHRYTNQDDVVVGTPVSGRTRADFAGTVGYFVNPVAIRLKSFDPESYRGFVKQVSQCLISAFEHQDYPFPLIVEKLHPERLNRPPLFQVMFVSQTGTSLSDGVLAAVASGQKRVRAEVFGIHFETMVVEHNATDLDLVLTVSELQGRLAVTIKYRSDVFEVATIERMAGHYANLLEAIATGPECDICELPLLADAESRELLVEWNQTEATDPADKCVHEIFEEIAEYSPEAVAVEYEEQGLTYFTLNRRANQLAHRLRQSGVGPESLVGICVERSPEMLIGLLAILKAGGAYLPLDPAYPQDRLTFMLRDSGALLVLVTQEIGAERMRETQARVIMVNEDCRDLDEEKMSNLRPIVSPRNIAYVIYTSGSTGKPKGVAILHSALTNVLGSFRKRLGISARDVLLSVTSLSFDIATLELLLPLIGGARVVIASAEQVVDPKMLADLLSRSHANVMQATPATWRSLAENWTGDRGLRVLCGGEALSAELAHELRSKSESLLNGYGPTETTIYSLAHEVRASEKSIPIGRPLANTRVYVLNANMQPAPVGVPGELLIGGTGLARGYTNQPELTAEKFVADPFSDARGERLYKTGDLVRWTENGTIEFLGRMDQQVKVRGFRVELGEIEAVLEQHDSVKQTVVVLREYKTDDKRLVAYVVTGSNGKNANVDVSLRAFAKAKLPEYMVPSAFVQLEALPRTANGKIERRQLPSVGLSDREFDPEPGSPRTAVEEMLVEAWREVLGVRRVGVHDNFFESGGHSLLATRLVSRIRKLWGVEIPVKTVFKCQTVADLARQIQSQEREQRGVALPTLGSRRRECGAPLSYGQQRLWFLEHLEKGSGAYHITAAIRLEGPLDIQALTDSFIFVIRRHEILRTTFPVVGSRAIQVAQDSGPLIVQRIDLHESPPVEAESRMRELLRQEHSAEFDLAKGPLLRCLIVSLGPHEHVLQLTMHHIISDGWSLGIMVREVAVSYRAYRENRTPILPDLPFQFGDYAVWQREWVENGAIDQQRAYWQKQLAGLEVLQLPTDHPRGRAASHAGRGETRLTNKEVQHQLKKISAENNVTLFMTLLSAFNVLLWRYSGQTDIAVGTPIAGRNLEELEPLIGFFVNTLVLRTPMGSGSRTFRELLREVSQISIDAFGNQDVPFEKLVEEVHPERTLSQTPLFQVMFVMQNAPLPELDLGEEIRVSRLANEELAAQFDLVLEVTETAEGLLIAAKYRKQLFNPPTIQRLLGHYQELVAAIISDPQQAIGALSMLGEEERQQVLHEWNQTGREYDGYRCIHELFEQQAMRTPEATAVEYERQQLSYCQLNTKANQLARQLRVLGVGAEVRVAICLERSLELMIALVGIMKTGGAYVPIDPAYPKERLSFMLGDAQAPVILIQERFLHLLPSRSGVICLDRDWEEIAEQSDQNLETAIDPQNSIYVIYTSGSTGTPKGAINTHGGVLNRLLWMQEAYRLGAHDHVLQKTTPSFDVSVWEFFWPLIAGARLIMARPDGHRDSRYLAEVIATRQITTLHFVPSMLNAFVQDGGLERCASLRRVISSGEALSVELQERFFAKSDAELHNLYGPTEAAVDVSFWQCERGRSNASVPIGRPIANMRLYILDEWMSPVPTGVTGDLYIAGIGVARGYLNRPELTAERFIANPFGSGGGERLYKTGDLARWRADGVIEYVGRIDHQVKIRGLRIELGEIEAVLQRHKTIKQALVRVREDRTGDRRLVGYVVSHAGASANQSDLREYLRQQLPEYMVPGAFVYLDAFPLNDSGKIDHKLLPPPEQRDDEMERTYVAPQTATQELLADIWAEVLSVSRVGIHDNFFELGGDSILSIEIIARANECGLPLTSRNMFEFQTIAELAQLAGKTVAVNAEQGRIEGQVPLTPIQKWFLEQPSDNPSHFNQAVLLEPKRKLDRDLLEQTIQVLVGHHDALRTRFRKQEAEWRQENLGEDVRDVVSWIDLSGVKPELESGAISREAEQWQASLNLEQGPLLRVVLMELRKGQRLLLILHHLATDAVSWQLLLHDMETIYLSIINGNKPRLRRKTTSFKQWAESLQLYASSDELLLESAYWNEIAAGESEMLPRDADAQQNLEKWAETVTYWLGKKETYSILQEIPASHKVAANESILAAFIQGLSEATGLANILVDIEGHGRESLRADVDVTRTVGWFTCLYPIRLQASGREEWNEILQRIKTQMRTIPRHGIGYGVLRYLAGSQSARIAKPEILFNYLGQLDHAFLRSELLKGLASEHHGTLRSPGFHRPYLIEVNSGVLGGQLYLSWTYGTRIHRRQRVEAWAEAVQSALRSLVRHCCETESTNSTPSDFTEVDLSQEEVDLIMTKMKDALA
jgi:amino acid adenylation domain-containing protein/non-ribosomal peptide synthase protein (TIGR01720 family)